MGLGLSRRLLQEPEDRIAKRLRKAIDIHGQVPPLTLALPYHPALDSISSYLPTHNRLHLIETNLALMEAYRSNLEELTLAVPNRGGYWRGDSSTTNTLIWLLGRIPRLNRITIKDRIVDSAVGEVRMSGRCPNLHHLELWCQEPVTGLVDLRGYLVFHALEDGHCPGLQTLRLVILGSPKMVLSSLVDCLASRRNKGLPSLTSLSIKAHPEPHDQGGTIEGLSTLARLPANEAVVELDLLPFWARWGIAPSEVMTWLLSTHAPHLQTFKFSCLGTPSITQALSSPGVALRLQSLTVHGFTVDSLLHLSQALQVGQWMHLKELSLTPAFNNQPVVIRMFMEALKLGAPDLRRLHISLEGTMGPTGVEEMMKGLRDGAADGMVGPSLEELEITGGNIGAEGPIVLATVLEEGAACSATLRRLCLRSTNLPPKALTRLMLAMKRGACPGLQCLNLSWNDSLRGRGLGPLLTAMKNAALPSLQELNLEGVGVDDQRAKAIMKVLGNGACPQLRKLCLGSHSITEPIKKQFQIQLSGRRSRRVALPVRVEWW